MGTGKEFTDTVVFTVAEQKASFGIQSIIQGSFDLVYYSETLPSELLELVIMMAIRRLHLQW